jgi:hypothetical protein
LNKILDVNGRKLQLYLRAFVTRAFGIDDCLVIIALVCFVLLNPPQPNLILEQQIMVLLFAALSIIVTFYGIGRHMGDVPLEQLPTMEYVRSDAFYFYSPGRLLTPHLGRVYIPLYIPFRGFNRQN